MRLDQFLKWSRIVPRRSMAKATCDAGRVLVNETAARAGRQISVGDVVAVDLPHSRMTFRVALVPERQPGKADAAKMVELLGRVRHGDSKEQAL